MVCKEGIKVILTKIKVILYLQPHVNPKQVRSFLGHTRNYRKFIRHYSNITFPMEEILRAKVPFKWNKKCTKSFETLNKKLIEAPILRFLN